jgi:hypothetical protein
MSDEWATQSTGISGPARNAAAVTPDDGVDLANVSRGIVVGTGGNIAVTMVGGMDVTIAVSDGAILPICVTRIKATGTTATGIVVLW